MLGVLLGAATTLLALVAPGSASALDCAPVNLPPGGSFLCGPVYHMQVAWAQSATSYGGVGSTSVCVRAWWRNVGYLGGMPCDNGGWGLAVLGVDNAPYQDGYALPYNNHPYNHYVSGMAQ